MTEAELLERLGSVLTPLGCERSDGREYLEPSLSECAVFARGVRLGRLPVFGRGLSVVSVVEVPEGFDLRPDGLAELNRRAGHAVCDRFPPYRGLSIGLTTVLVGSEAVAPDDDRRLAEVLQGIAPTRVVPLGLFLLDLERGQMAGALRRGPEGLYPEPEAVHDALVDDFGRFLPLVDG